MGSRQRITDPEIRAIWDALRAQGWTLEMGKHLKFMSPEGKKFFTSRTPSDHRSTKNFSAELRRHGDEL